MNVVSQLRYAGISGFEPGIREFKSHPSDNHVHYDAIVPRESAVKPVQRAAIGNDTKTDRESNTRQGELREDGISQ